LVGLEKKEMTHNQTRSSDGSLANGVQETKWREENQPYARNHASTNSDKEIAVVGL
jgi:hypothetical protein